MIFENSQNEIKVNLKKMRKNLEENFQKRRWTDEWKAIAQPIFIDVNDNTNNEKSKTI